MSQVVTGVTQKLQDLLPGQIGANLRWTTADVERHIMLADRAVRERTESRYHQQEIDLTDGEREYALDSEFIDVVSVEFAADGVTFDEYLHPVTLSDLDKINIKWRDDGGSEPEYYTLLGAPGTPGCKIIIYKPVTTVDSQAIRITGIGLGASDDDVPEDIQGSCHVPYVMATLMASADPQEAVNWYGQFVDGCDKLRRRIISKYPQGTANVRFGW